MNILVINNGSKHTHKLLAQLNKHKVKIVKYRRNTRLDREWADLFILTGSNIPAFLSRYYKHEIQLLQSTTKPVIGICLGFELIALAYGENISRSTERVEGVIDISVSPEFLGSENKTTYNVFEAHRWIMASASRLEVIGTSVHGVEVVRHPNKLIIGFQFHPEVTIPANEGAALFQKTLRYILNTKETSKEVS